MAAPAVWGMAATRSLLEISLDGEQARGGSLARYAQIDAVLTPISVRILLRLSKVGAFSQTLLRQNTPDLFHSSVTPFDFYDQYYRINIAINESFQPNSIKEQRCEPVHCHLMLHTSHLCNKNKLTAYL